MSYPYSTREVVADGLVHAMGLGAAFTGVSLLLLHTTRHASVLEITAVSIYAAFLLLALLASAAYHMLPFEAPRPWLHRIDHAAIYLKIAGTYTPLVALIGSAFAYAVLAGVWIIALAGAIAKLSFWRTDARGSLALYLAMGWACLLLAGPMIRTLPVPTLWLIAIGGLLYTVGTAFFASRDLPFQNAIWHAFVLAASTCFFCAISLAQLA